MRIPNSRYITLPGKYLGQRAAINEIHDEVMPASLNEVVTHVRDIGMVQLEQGCRLALKPIDGLAALDIAPITIQHFLHRAWRIIKARIYGAIYRRHPAGCYGPYDPVAPS